MNTIDYLEAVKKRLQITSDYRLSKDLKIPQTTVSNWRNGKRQLDDENAIKFAQILEMPPGVILADMHAERATDTITKNTWSKIAKQLQAIAVTVLLSVVLIGSPTDTGAVLAGFGLDNNIHYA